ncbi:MAG: hypothetical protein AAF355_15255 [Myxococcota bacterium]
MCVECLSEFDCTAGIFDGIIQPERELDALSAMCSQIDSTCVECDRDEHCESGVCDENTRRCVECTVDSQCASPTPYCDWELSQRCVECVPSRADDHCPESLCILQEFDEVPLTCAPCVTDEQCTSPTPYCDWELSQRCVECVPDRADDHCPDSSCDPETMQCTT